VAVEREPAVPDTGPEEPDPAPAGSAVEPAESAVPAADPERPDRAPPRLTWHVFALAAVVLGLDQLAKLWAASALAGREPVAVLGDLIQFRLTYNSGGAFSIGRGNTWVFTLAAAVVVVVIARVARRVGSRAWAVSLGLLLGGAVSHLLDRLFREPGFARGHVLDFIDYAGLFVGNVADIAITCGVALMILVHLRGLGINGRPAS
jgi:signal peptidase II